MAYIPIAEYRDGKDAGYTTILTNAFIANKKYQNVLLQSVSIAALHRLGLINIDYNSWITNGERYKGFYETDEYNTFVQRIKPPAKEVVLGKGVTILTPLGENFVKVCLNDCNF